ncbi:hypothetical protein CVT25_007864 [Psilocybe cyanescens]|uniref:Uncharacterized protein n=1 Tax=Psilocybe cyanescens TaxID=93625 RepID=A0A409VXU3_PSICY|nr:hypothetical protein CVT25_007864 [Psilocybe cyanescens]
MANLIRSAKSGRAWTLYDLDSYNIHLKQQEPLEFFGVPVLPDPAVDPELLQHLEANNMQQHHNARLIKLVDLVMLRSWGESAIVDFTVELLQLTGYDHQNRLARRRIDMPLFLCGKWRHMKTDVCLMDCKQNNILLVVQGDKWLEDREPLNARARLVAEALAAFTKNNANRQSSPLESKVNIPVLLTVSVMPGIVMVDTTPIFFKIPVTQELVTHVQQGTYPPTPTIATYCFPPLPCHISDGMKPLSNRHQILSCCEAFKTIIGI